MKSLILAIAFLAHAEMSEPSIVKAFNKAPNVYKKFHADTMKYRGETEAYNEKEFEPSVDRMIVLLGEGKCKACLTPYLNGLSYLDGSASEALTDQLKVVISKYPKDLSAACKGLNKKARKGLSGRFKDAVGFLAAEKKVDKAAVEKEIAGCL